MWVFFSATHDHFRVFWFAQCFPVKASVMQEWSLTLFTSLCVLMELLLRTVGYQRESLSVFFFPYVFNCSPTWSVSNTQRMTFFIKTLIWTQFVFPFLLRLFYNLQLSQCLKLVCQSVCLFTCHMVLITPPKHYSIILLYWLKTSKF